MSPYLFDVKPVGNAHYQEVVHRSLYTPEQCDHIRGLLDGDAWAPAGITQTGTDAPHYDTKLRSAGLQNLPLDGSWPLDDLVQALGEINAEVFRFRLTGLFESDRPSVARYRAEDGAHFRPHQDAGPQNACRKLTYIVQLSDPGEYAGGDLFINDAARLAPRDQGTLVVFPSSMHHVVSPITAGTRDVIVGWVHGPTMS